MLRRRCLEVAAMLTPSHILLKEDPLHCFFVHTNMHCKSTGGGWAGLVLGVVSSGWCWTRDQTRTEWQVGRHCKYTSNNPDFHHATQLGHQGYPQLSPRYFKTLIQTPLSWQSKSVNSKDLLLAKEWKMFGVCGVPVSAWRLPRGWPLQSGGLTTTENTTEQGAGHTPIYHAVVRDHGNFASIRNFATDSFSLE